MFHVLCQILGETESNTLFCYSSKKKALLQSKGSTKCELSFFIHTQVQQECTTWEKGSFWISSPFWESLVHPKPMSQATASQTSLYTENRLSYFWALSFVSIGSPFCVSTSSTVPSVPSLFATLLLLASLFTIGSLLPLSQDSNLRFVTTLCISIFFCIIPLFFSFFLFICVLNIFWRSMQ